VRVSWTPICPTAEKENIMRGAVLRAPGKDFDPELPLDQAAEAYRAMDERRAIKALLRV
jgi:hypothetical protein